MANDMQFDESELRFEARNRMASGRLPREPEQSLWAGTGDGQPCSLCDRLIDAQQVEYEVEFVGDPRRLYRFHRVCHQAWELECIK
jgi:hypothetical protein